MTYASLPSQDAIKQLLWYHPESGDFRWRNPGGSVKPWDKAGWIAKNTNGNSYIRIKIYGLMHKAHRLAWVYMTGQSPPEFIDHIDGNGNNNAWTNLRLATNKQNGENVKLSKKNKSGHRGVTFHKKFNKWQAKVVHDGQQFYLGLHETAEAAAAVAEAKRQELFTHYHGRT
jgi:hypothetical protein